MKHVTKQHFKIRSIISKRSPHEQDPSHDSFKPTHASSHRVQTRSHILITSSLQTPTKDLMSCQSTEPCAYFAWETSLVSIMQPFCTHGENKQDNNHDM